MTKAIFLSSLPALVIAAMPALATPFVDVSFPTEAAPVPSFIRADAADVVGPWITQDRPHVIGAHTVPSLPAPAKAGPTLDAAGTIRRPFPGN